MLVTRMPSSTAIHIVLLSRATGRRVFLLLTVLLVLRLSDRTGRSIVPSGLWIATTMKRDGRHDYERLCKGLEM
jgi:hypothetical protein